MQNLSHAKLPSLFTFGDHDLFWRVWTYSRRCKLSVSTLQWLYQRVVHIRVVLCRESGKRRRMHGMKKTLKITIHHTYIMNSSVDHEKHIRSVSYFATTGDWRLFYMISRCCVHLIMQLIHPITFTCSECIQHTFRTIPDHVACPRFSRGILNNRASDRRQRILTLLSTMKDLRLHKPVE